MYLRLARTKVAKSNYAEGSRLLEIIEYRHPKFHEMAEVKNMQNRIAATKVN